MYNGEMTFPLIAHVALTVSDLERSVAWYSALIGTPPALQGDADGYGLAVWLRPSLGLHHFPAPIDEPFDERRNGLDHVAFDCASRAELESWATRLDELGVTRGEILDEWYDSGLSFRDPDNIALEFFVLQR